ncbi:hypothetical protein V6Z11_A07G089100 [Gossypium hirsutum]
MVGATKDRFSALLPKESRATPFSGQKKRERSPFTSLLDSIPVTENKLRRRNPEAALVVSKKRAMAGDRRAEWRWQRRTEKAEDVVMRLGFSLFTFFG